KPWPAPSRKRRGPMPCWRTLLSGVCCLRQRLRTNKGRLRLKPYLIARPDILADALSQRPDVLDACPAMIDQHQCLALVHADRAQPPPLPARLLDQPARRQFDALRCRVADQSLMLLTQGFILRKADHRVLEKTARIAQYGGIRQFGAANRTNGVI